MRTTPAALAARYRAEGHWSDTRLGDLYAAAAVHAPDRVAVVDPPNRVALDGAEPHRLEWRTLSVLIDATMVALADAGLKRDDVLVTQLPNVAEYIAVYIAAARLGVILSPVPMQFRRNELEPIVRFTRPRALLTVRTFKGTEPARLAVELSGPAVLVLGHDAPAGAQPFAPDIRAASASSRARELEHSAEVAADDILTICWTSGTEGVPKGVPRSHNHWNAISCAHLDGAQLRRGDTLLNPFPLVNMAAVGGCFMSWLHSAGTLLLHHPFELAVYLRQIATERPQYAIAPPAVLNMLLQNEALLGGVDLSCLRCIGSGSAPLAPAMIRGYQQRYGIEVINMFGSNEGVSLCSGPAEAPEPERRARFFPRFGRHDVEWPQRISRRIETRIVDPASGAQILEPAQPGELEIRGATVFDGYFGAPAHNAKAFTADGWFRTGDLFEIAEPGDARFYRFIGRLTQIINRGGMKISPDELDAVLAEHPDLAEAAVVGYPDEVLGERVCAVIVPKPGKSVSLESLQAHFSARQVAVYKWPERVRTVEFLPRNPVGKVVRATIARIAAEEGGIPS